MSSYLLKPSNAGIYQINALNVGELWINGMSINDFVAAAGLEHALTDAEIVELKAIVSRIDIAGLTGNWIVDDTNRNAVLKGLIDTLTNRVDGTDTSIGTINTNIGTLNTKTKYITTTDGTGPIVPGTGAVFPASHIINPSATSGADWNVVRLIADIERSYITVADDTSVFGGVGGAGRDEIIIHHDTKVRIEGAEVSLLGTMVNVGKSGGEVAFPSIPITQPISISGLAWDIATGTTPGFIIAKLIAQACLPNYTDVFGFKTAIITRDKYVTTTNGITIKDYTLYNLDAVNALPVESTYIAHGNIGKSCVFGDQNYWSGSGAIELRVDDFGNIGSTTLNDKANKTNKVKVSNQNVEIRSNNGSAGNIVLHNGCVDGSIQFRKGIDGTDAVSNTAMEIISPSGASWHLTSQVIIGADTRAGVAQTEVYQAKSKLIVDTTSFSFTGTGKVGIHGIQVSNNKAYGDGGVGVDNTYVDPANVSTKSLTLQDNYTGATTKTLYTDTNANLMYNGQQVAMGSAVASGGGLTYVISCPSTTTITTPSYTFPTNLTMSGTYTSTENRTITLSAYANNTNYQLCTIKGLVLASSNPVLDGTFELNQHVNYTGSLVASLYAKLYFVANTPASTLLINKTYTSPAGSGSFQVINGASIPVPANDLVLILTSVTFPQVFANSGSASTTLGLTVVNQSGTVLYTFPTLTVTGGTTADRTFTPASSPQTITVTSAITSFRFVLTNTSGTSPSISQPTAQNVNNANYSVGNGSSVKMLLYDGTSNKTALTPATQAIYALSLPLPVNPFVITDWITPYIQVDEFFVQPAGSTTGNTCVLQFNDGNLSHLHTSIATIPTVTTPTLAQVLVAGSIAGSAINMNNNDITNVGNVTANIGNLTTGNITNVAATTVGATTGNITTINATTGNITTVASTTVGATTGNITTVNSTTVNATTLVPTAITGWNVKSIVAGTGVTVSSASGAVTINSTATGGIDNEVGHLINQATALPTKPFWYNTTYSWLYNTTNFSITDNYSDIYVSNTGQYQMLVAADRIRSSVDWGVTYANTNLTSFYLNSVCGTGTGNRYYICGAYRVFYYDAIYSTFGSTASYLTSFPTLSGSISYTRMRCSIDGKYILIGSFGLNGRLYKSNDYGVTSTSQDVFGSYCAVTDVAMSADGKYQFFIHQSGTGFSSFIRYSTNYGSTWNIPTVTGSAGTNLTRMVCSATGQFVTVINQGTGQLISNDYGKTFIYSSNSLFSMVNGICMSANGQFQLATHNNSVWESEDYGRSWYVGGAILTNTPEGMCIGCSATAGYAVVGGNLGKSWVTYDSPTDVRSITAGTNITVTPLGFGTYQIASSGGSSVVTPSVFAGTPIAISSIGGYSNNQYWFGNSTYDFDNYNYDIEFVINQGSGNGYLLHFCWDNNVDFTYYQVMYNDWDATGNYIGSNPTAAFMYTQNINGFQASYKGTLRAIPAVSASNYNRLMLEGTMSMNSQSSGTRAFSAPARSSKTIISYAGTLQNSITQFNGSHSFSMWATVSNYASNNPCNMRITRVMKNLPGS